MVSRPVRPVLVEPLTEKKAALGLAGVLGFSGLDTPPSAQMLTSSVTGYPISGSTTVPFGAEHVGPACSVHEPEHQSADSRHESIASLVKPEKCELTQPEPSRAAPAIARAPASPMRLVARDWRRPRIDIDASVAFSTRMVKVASIVTSGSAGSQVCLASLKVPGTSSSS